MVLGLDFEIFIKSKLYADMLIYFPFKTELEISQDFITSTIVAGRIKDPFTSI